MVGSWLTAIALALAAQTGIPEDSFEVYLCPVHRDEQSVGPAMCPRGDREMVKRILVSSYSCPMHQNIVEDHEGECPICSMKLAPTTRELQWFCPDNPEIVRAVPGNCPDGSSMHMRSIPMAHGDHNPKHGGILFMAPNGYNHLEGTLDEEGTFRLYLYNDFTKPIDATPFEADVDGVGLKPAGDGEYLSASLAAPNTFPTEHVVHVKFPGGADDPSRFDFVFVESMVTGEGRPEPTTLILPEFRIPETADGIFEAIMHRDARVRELIDEGVWPDLYIPALEAKDLALALDEKEGDEVAVPVKKLVRAAWLLDVYGDQGNREEVERAYQLFERAIRELEAARAP